MSENGFFYMMTNAFHTVLYCGATDDLYRRITEHKNKVYFNSFTNRYNIDKLVYFERLNLVADAFAREMQVKAGSRKKKLDLMQRINPEWNDLFDKLPINSLDELIKIKRFLK